MIDPATGAIIGATGGSLTLLNAIVKICRERDKNPTGYPPNMAEVIAALPGAALELTGKIIAEINKLRAECRAAGIDPRMTMDKLRETTWFYQRKRRTFMKIFQKRVEAIGDEISILFDDVVSVADCCDRLNDVSRSFKESKAKKDALKKEIADDLPFGEVLDNLLRRAEEIRADLGDLNRKPKKG